MPLIAWIMQNLQISYPSIFVGGTSSVSIQYQVKMQGGVVIQGVAKNSATQSTCNFVICDQGLFCYHNQSCSCNAIFPLPPLNGFSLGFGGREAAIPATVRCGRPDLIKIFKQRGNSLAHVPYFVGPPKYLFIVRSEPA